MIKEVWSALKEAIGMIFDMVYTSTSIYISGLKKLIRNSAIATLALLGISIPFALFSIYWPLKLSVFAIGLIFITLLVAAFPILVLASVAQEEVPAIRRMFRLYAAIVFWILQIMIYFSIVPIQNALAVIPLVLLLFAAIAFGFVAYGFKAGINPKWAVIRTVVILCLVTIFLFFPQTHEYISLAAERVNERVIIWLRAPKAIEYRPGLVFFNTVTGKSKVWFYKRGDGGFDLFDQRGFHPVTREELQPVTPETVIQILEWQKEEERQKMEAAATELIKRQQLGAEERVKKEEEGDIKQKEEQQAAERQACLDQLAASSWRLHNASDRFAIIPTVNGQPMTICGEPVVLRPLQTTRIFPLDGQIGGKSFGASASGEKKEFEITVQSVNRPGFVGFVLQESNAQKEELIQQQIILPRGTPITVRLSENLSTDENFTGQEFTTYLTGPLVAGDLVIAEGNAEIKGIIVESKKAGRVKGVSSLSLKLVRIAAASGTRVDITTNILRLEGKTSKGSDIARILGGAAAGTIVGALVGDRKGAGEGAVGGAVVGITTVIATRGRALELPSETVLRFYLDEPVFLPR